VGAIVTATVALVRAAEPGRDYDIETTVAPNLPTVLLERRRCERMFANLINNALDAVEAGGAVCLHVYAEQEHVCVQVQDTGGGVTEAMKRRIFEPLVSTKGDKGLGIGLAVVKAVMDGHGGTIECESTPGRGTTFTAKFPMAAPNHARRKPAPRDRRR
jgi:signal transduction histidine kinase